MGHYKLKSLNPAMLQEFINSKYKNDKIKIQKYDSHSINEKYIYEQFSKTYYSKDLITIKENGELVFTESLNHLSRVVNYDLGISFNFHSLRHTFHHIA